MGRLLLVCGIFCLVACDNKPHVVLVLDGLSKKNTMADFTNEDFPSPTSEGALGNCQAVAELLNAKWPQNNYRCDVR
jgi:hypothetical protein